MSSPLHHTLRFGDLPVGTDFLHPRTNEIYKKISHHKTYNAHGPSFLLIHPDTIVKLTSNIDFYSLEYSTKFAYENTAYIKIARNRAKAVNDPDNIKYFEPDDSVSPL